MFFCGAGISFNEPSKLPGAITLKNGLVKSMLGSLEFLRINVDFQYIKNKLDASPLELLLDALVTPFGRGTLKYLNVLDSLNYNLNHYYLANLANQNNNFNIITLNFDVLIEQALDEFDLNYKVICPLSSNLKRITNKNDTKILLVKPHGSFDLPNCEGNRLKNISTTVSEIRDKPDDRTLEVFRKVLTKTPKILIAGYNGEDWDILPILSILKEEIEDIQVYWVKHQEKNIVKPVKQVCEFLATLNDQASLLYGDISKLLKDIILKKNISINPELINLNRKIKSHSTKIDNSLFTNNYPATALAVASLLQESERSITKKILDALKNRDEIIKQPSFHQAYCNIAAWWNYIGKSFDKGIALREAALSINRNLLRRKDSEIASDIISTGYQYVSYAKPRSLKPTELLKAPFYLIKGFRYLIIGWRVSDKTKQKAFAKYYAVDFWHNWFALVLLFENRFIEFIRKYLFKLITRKYKRINDKYKGHMDREYFFMRQIEAEVLSGLKPDLMKSEIRLIEIERYFRLTNQLDHLRNVCITKAFLSYSDNPESNDIKRYMDFAQVDKDNIKDIMKNEQYLDSLSIDSCINEIIKAVEKSPEKRTMTITAIKRYKIFEKFFFPKSISVKNIWSL